MLCRGSLHTNQRSATPCSLRMIVTNPRELYLAFFVTYKALVVVEFAVEELYQLLRLQYTTHKAHLYSCLPYLFAFFGNLEQIQNRFVPLAI